MSFKDLPHIDFMPKQNKRRLTQLDYFAARALPRLLPTPLTLAQLGHRDEEHELFAIAVERAYEVAQMMLRKSKEIQASAPDPQPGLAQPEEPKQQAHAQFPHASTVLAELRDEAGQILRRTHINKTHGSPEFLMLGTELYRNEGSFLQEGMRQPVNIFRRVPAQKIELNDLGLVVE